MMILQEDRTGRTPLHWAAFQGAEVVLDLIQAGADVNVYDSEGETPLMYAASSNSIDVVRVLIEAGANVNDRADDERTALIIAAQEGHTDMVELLIQAGADVYARDDEGNSALRFAASQAMNRWIPRHRSRQRDRLGLGYLHREGTPFRNDRVYRYIQQFL